MTSYSFGSANTFPGKSRAARRSTGSVKADVNQRVSFRFGCYKAPDPIANPQKVLRELDESAKKSSSAVDTLKQAQEKYQNEATESKPNVECLLKARDKACAEYNEFDGRSGDKEKLSKLLRDADINWEEDN